MNKKLTGVVLGITLIGIAIITSQSIGSGFSNANVKTEVGEYTVTLTESGFEPNSITIPEGSTIRFKNERNKSFWPASNIHPEHNIYSEFDPRKPIPAEEIWSFTFTKKGQWEYHDHLAPHFTGTINVGTTEDIAELENDECNQGYQCWRKTLLSILHEDGVNKAYEKVEELYNQYKSFKSSCHGIAHDLGIPAYGIYKEKGIDSVLTPRVYYCAYGFYHGFMEAFLGDQHDVTEARDFCIKVGERMADKAPDAGLQCFHGIGHGIIDTVFIDPAVAGRLTTEEQIANYATSQCEKATDTEKQRYRCVSGVFNGIANYYTYNNSYGLEVREDDPLWLCKIQPDKYKESCYGNMNSTLQWMGDMDHAREYIQEIEDDQLAKKTMNYLGAVFAIKLADDNPKKAIDNCREYGDRLHHSCIQGFVGGFIEHGKPEQEYTDAARFCKNQYLTIPEKEVCWDYYSRAIKGWYIEGKWNNICSFVEEGYQNICYDEINKTEEK